MKENFFGKIAGFFKDFDPSIPDSLENRFVMKVVDKSEEIRNNFFSTTEIERRNIPTLLESLSRHPIFESASVETLDNGGDEIVMKFVPRGSKRASEFTISGLTNGGQLELTTKNGPYDEGVIVDDLTCFDHMVARVIIGK